MDLEVFASYQPPTREFAGIEVSKILEIQNLARKTIGAIALLDNNPSVQTAAVEALGRGLLTPGRKGITDKADWIQLVAIIGNTSKDPGVKDAAVRALTNYALISNREGAFGGFNAPVAEIESQKLANRAVPAVVK